MSQGRQETEWTIKALLQWTTEHFQKASIESPRLCAEILLSHVLKCKRLELYTRFDFIPEPDKLAEFKKLIKRCINHEPVQYLIGSAGFYSLDFIVNSSVLIPRPETEAIVTAAIDYLRSNNIESPTALDLCTGSSCIACALAKNNPDVKIIAIDISVDALETASRNIESHNLDDRITLIQSDMFSNIPADQTFDLLLSNPPYVNDKRMNELPANVKHEPRSALHGGDDGLDFYKIIINEGTSKINPGGQLIIEIDHDQSGAITEMLEATQQYENIKILRDHNNHERIMLAQKTS
ncbi:MAG: peptide chain release factor N(5)-glutamine methyltransferase [Phycisphaerae bacterium]|nr:peptide chain release factor N(5)-glutamine methyltransferase [Phycisphaerae bacterium]